MEEEIAVSDENGSKPITAYSVRSILNSHLTHSILSLSFKINTIL